MDALHLAKFNNGLNMQTDQNRHSDWAKYREMTTDLIIKRMNDNHKNNSNVLIIGAGNCDDINLQQLIENSKNIICLDIDAESVRRGFQKQKCASPIVIPMDITGLSYRKIYSKIVRCSSYQEAIKCLYPEIQTGYTLSKEILKILSKYRNFFDMIIFMPVFTQLFGALRELLILQFPGMENKIMLDLEKYEPLTAASINKMIDYVAAPNCMVFGVSDVYELPLNTHQELIAETQLCIQKGLALPLEKLQTRALLGRNIFYDCISNKALEQNTLFNCYFWPFNNQKWYLVHATYYMK